MSSGDVLTLEQYHAMLKERSKAKKPPAAARAAGTAGRSKYRNVPTVVDGIRFASKAEARYYAMLRELRDSGASDGHGKLLYFLRQVPFHLPGGVRYVCDFMEVRSGAFADIRLRYVDVKGVETAEFRLKRKQVRALYGVEIETWSARAAKRTAPRARR